MVYLNGVGYVDERSYNASKKLTNANNSGDFNTVLQKETIIYAMPESTGTQATGTSNSGTKGVSTPAELEEYFQKAASKYGISINLLKAVAKQESNFDPTAVSSVGATGIMQLMPSTAKELGVENIFNAEQNIMGGAKYLSQLLNSFNGDVSLALAGYNAGPGNVRKYGGIPPFQETVNYVNKVLSYMEENLSVADSASLQAVTNDNDVVNAIFSVATKDATQTPKIYTIQSQEEDI